MRLNNHKTQNTNKKEPLQPTDKENEALVETNEEDYIVHSDEKDNSFNPQQKQITSSDDTITSSDATIIIQKSESSKTKADKAESNISFEPVYIQKKSLHQKILHCILQIRLKIKHPYKS